jgi:predicted RNase H-like HicB family nuclease
MSKHSILVQWSEEDEAFIATVPELPGLSTFGSSPEKAVEELSIAKEAYLEVLSEDGEETPAPDVLRPFSGQTRLRLPKSLHAFLSDEAKKEGVSLNTYIVKLLSERSVLRHVSEELESIIRKVDSLKQSIPGEPDKIWIKAAQDFESGRRSEVKAFYKILLSSIPELKENAEEEESDSYEPFLNWHTYIANSEKGTH